MLGTEALRSIFCYYYSCRRRPAHARLASHQRLRPARERQRHSRRKRPTCHPAEQRLWVIQHHRNSPNDRAAKASSSVSQAAMGLEFMNGKIRKNISNCATVVTAIYLGSIGIAIGQDARRSSSAGVFSAEQVKRGNAAYNVNCASCHGSDLLSTDREFPSLTAASFRFSWIGKTIGEKFEFIRNTMPPKEERSLDDQVYLDIVTYILHFNKIPSGDQTLQPDPEILKQIVISAPPT